MPAWSELTLQLIRAARDEDLANVGDLTSALLSDASPTVAAAVRTRQPGVACGLALCEAVLSEFAVRLRAAMHFTAIRRDGDAVHARDVLATVHGPRASLLAVERTLLNFLSRMSGVATFTRAHVDAAKGANPAVELLDTRKTMPGWRELDKYAVRCGGGMNHRTGLYDAVLIKDNHLAGVPTERLAATLAQMLGRVARLPGRPAFVEVEVDSLEQFREVLCVAGVDFVLLDNFPVESLRQAVALRDDAGLRDRLLLEASGGVNLSTIAAIAAAGVDRISVGAITQSAPSLDIGLDLEG